VGIVILNEQKITCHFCFEEFEVDLGIEQTFSGHNVEIFDCQICCNPNKVDSEAYEGHISSIIVTDGNE